jgi:NAD(P)H-dependent FMN reductase
MEETRPLYIPVLLGTVRQGRRSEAAARFVLRELEKRPEVRTELLDLRDLPLVLDDAGEQAKIPDFSRKMAEADGLVLVVPEYNHGYPGLLKHALDTNLKEYIHKAAGLVGVSVGPWGGIRVIEHMLPVLREMGFTTIFYDIAVRNVSKTFDDEGNLLDDSLLRASKRFFDELIWMARTLRMGRETLG